MLDAHGDRVDTTGDPCGEGKGCGAQAVAITLPPGGTAWLPFAVDARKLSYDASCTEKRAGKVAPGTYDLDVFSTLGELHAHVSVR